ncbi:hypothetical protein D8674_038209 [Pyrus ussuriensis x Pyrus communis]|uniref:Cytochrome b6-f complex subunit 7 n=1 Tax=Pyrus ussuriensis x Pyrus communis TaxID=2448454 RepID=A0A5N5I4N4_9ROSA|nr:cytochrome b6-f complex subunit 7, chloroplastic-like [Pyrus x bretschneideri]KAB2634789.1 hypothetical protein D8674_038209 [Pyrus ussuriensis x Pyrus communis]
MPYKTQPIWFPFISLLVQTTNPVTKKKVIAMATASATVSPAMVAATTVAKSRRMNSSANNVTYITGLNAFSGLKAQSSVASLGLPQSTEQSFARVVSSLRAPSRGNGGGGGGALSSTCNAVGEIFKIAAILNGLTLVGVAVGFVLLRIEAAVEEAAEAE